jgi:hypothetical protein
LSELQLDPQFVLHSVGENYPGKQVALALVQDHNGSLRCVGSAFAVAPGLAITASHIIDDCVKYQARREGYERPNPAVALAAVQSYDQKFFVWSVDYIYGSVSSDIAFLRFVRPSWWGDGPGQAKPRCARLDLNPPAVGDRVRVFGFPNSEIIEGVLNIFPAECECQVKTVDVRTDSPTWYKPLAHIEVEGEIGHGMSGGPCFDKDWNVIGVNSLSWSGGPTAKVALLWPAMKIEIDPFKTGAFPAIELFKNPATRALGYRRVHVTSKGEARFAREDPDRLVLGRYFGMTEHLAGTIDFSAAGAQEALAELRDILSRANEGSEPPDSNKVIRLARHYFWELDAALSAAILLAARQAKISAPEPLSWEQLVHLWKEQTLSPEVLDEIATLEFEWNGADLFDLRGHAELCRRGALTLQCMQRVKDGVPSGPIIAESLEPPARSGGPQLFLPDGLDRFTDASRRFVQRLLNVSRVVDQNH